MPAVPDLSGRHLTIRSDGDSQIGTGHAMRCLAVARGWIAAGGTVRLACTSLSPALSDRYAASGVGVDTRATWPAEAVVAGADTVLADSPYVDDDALHAIGAAAPLLVMIDDSGARQHYPGGILVNQNAHADPALYRSKTEAELCLGTAWCLLRPEFAPNRKAAKANPPTLRSILVMMGGADPHGHSGTLLTGVAKAAATLTPAPGIVLLVGAANPEIGALRRQAAAAGTDVSIRHDVQDMPALLAAADLAVSAAGSTVWELAVIGTPMVLGAQNDTETGPAAAMADRGAAVYLGRFEAMSEASLIAAVTALARDPARRAAMSAAGRAQVDGYGVDRLLATVAQRLPPAQGESR